MNKLTEFPEEVLRAMLGAVIYKSEDMKAHVRKIKSYGPDAEKLLSSQLAEIHENLEHLLTAEIQIATALASVQIETKIRLN